MRLRRQAKWVFLGLAIVFAGGFIFFGVGTGNSGLGDLFSGNLFGGGGGPSISKLQKEVAAHPNNAQAHLELARALIQKEREEEAIPYLERYTQLRQKDAGAWQQLAGLYLIRAQHYYDQLQAISQEAATLPGSGFVVPPGSFLEKELQKNPFYKAVSQDIARRQQEAQSGLTQALSQRAYAYRQAVNALPPDDTSLPGTIFAWARAAEDAQDYKTALQAYQRYLKIAPDSALARDARAAIQRLKAILKAQGNATGAGG
jgi:predicted Zn-dependent protease